MFRLSGLLLIGFAVFVGSLLFKTSQSVQRAENDLLKIEQALKKENESHRILTVEWDYLNRPERLERLTQRNLDIDDMKSDKAGFIQSNDSIPEPRMPAIPQIKPQAIFQYASSKREKTKSQKDTVIQNAESESFEKEMNKNNGGEE